MASKPVTRKSGAAQRNPITQNAPPGPAWKSSAKEDGVRAQGPIARDSGKAPFPGTVSGAGVAEQETPTRQRTKDYAGGRSEVQPREAGVKDY